MFHPLTIFGVVCGYIGLLFVLAMWVEKRSAQGRTCWNNAFIYSLSLAIYCTSWTYYGSVGNAATSGLLYLAIYLGPTLGIILWGSVLKKFIQIKHDRKINSIADFIAARYDNSHRVAALVTIITIIGIAPYIALQIKAIMSTFAVIADPAETGGSFITANVGPVIIGLMVAFTIIFGVRRLDPTERHQGMVAAVAVESMMKLVTFILVGIFVCFILFDGFGDIFSQYHKFRSWHPLPEASPGQHPVITWFTYLILSMSAIMFLPRQFHVAVVENSNENHVNTARWLLPLYLLLINIFVLPIAMAGLLKGISLERADSYVLLLPQLYGDSWLTMMVFIGGFSAAASMIMISSMTMATMITNHLLLPLVTWMKWLSFLRRHLLRTRWVAVFAVVLLGYWFERTLAGSFTLVNIGMISFAAALLFAPVIIFGIYWPRGNKYGAIAGLLSGFCTWIYTLLLPSFIKSGWINSSLLETGPWGVKMLCPEHLFGITGLNYLSHAVFWTLIINTGMYVLVSLFTHTGEAELRNAESFVNTLEPYQTISSIGKLPGLPIDLKWKQDRFITLLNQYFTGSESERIYLECLESGGFVHDRPVSVPEFAGLCSRIEQKLTGAIGITVAHKAVEQAGLFSSDEAEELSRHFGKIVADLKITPEELRRRIDYHEERESLISAHARDLGEKIVALEEQIQERKRAEKALRESEGKYRLLVDSAGTPIINYKLDTTIQFINQAGAERAGKSPAEIVGKKVEETIPGLGRLITHRIQEILATGTGGNFEDMLDLPNARLWFFANYQPIRNEAGEIDAIQMIAQDITERKQAEEELQRLRNLLSNIIDSMPSMLIGVDTENHITHWNREAVAMTGIMQADALNRRIGNICPSLAFIEDKVLPAITNRNPLKESKISIVLDEQPVMLDITVYPLIGEEIEGAVIRIDDITERIRMEEMMIQSEKMLSVGGLAAGMAHEINNPLAGIMQNIQVMKNRLGPDLPKNISTAEDLGINVEQVTEYIRARDIYSMMDTITQCGHRAAQIVSNMLSFSRKSGTDFVEQNLADLLNKTIDLAASDYDLKKRYDFRNIAIRREFEPDLPEIRCNPGKIQQVCLNILKNGAEAMAAGSIEHPEFIIRVHQKNSMAVIEISDNGAGMNENTRKRVFEPFFTTKDPHAGTDAGTGLGLSVSYFIITENHGGEMAVESSLGKGTTFIVRLPLVRPRD